MLHPLNIILTKIKSNNIININYFYKMDRLKLGRTIIVIKKAK